MRTSRGSNNVSVARKLHSRVLCLLTNGVLDIMFNPDTQVVNNVQDDNDGVTS